MEERGKYSLNWTSERFNKNMTGLPLLYHFFTEDKYKEVTDAWGDKCTIVGYSEGIKLVHHAKDKVPYDIPKSALVVRHRDNALFGVHYSQLNYNGVTPKPLPNKFL
jgi:hypothetical protein